MFRSSIKEFSSVNALRGLAFVETGEVEDASNRFKHTVPGRASRMDSSNDNSREIVPPSSPIAPRHETSRARSIATRLTEAEFCEVEASATDAGKKVAEWLREAALAHARASQEEQTDRILLTEIMAMRALMLNLFAKASQGPLSTEDMRKMSVYSDSIKEQKAEELLAQRRHRKSLKTLGNAS
jgi:hypothetical protein